MHPAPSLLVNPATVRGLESIPRFGNILQGYAGGRKLTPSCSEYDQGILNINRFTVGSSLKTAHLRFSHGAAHGRGRLCDGIGSQIYHAQFVSRLSTASGGAIICAYLKGFVFSIEKDLCPASPKAFSCRRKRYIVSGRPSCMQGPHRWQASRHRDRISWRSPFRRRTA